MGPMSHALSSQWFRYSSERALIPSKYSFGIYLYAEDVEALAVEFAEEIIEHGKKPEIKEWGMLEFSVNGPDGCLVRVGWLAEEVQMSEKKPEESG